MRRLMTGALTTAGGISAVLVGLVAIDPSVRSEVMQVLNGRPPTGEFVNAGNRVQEAATIVLQAVRDQSIEHAPLAIFALAAMVLVMFILRT